MLGAGPVAGVALDDELAVAHPARRARPRRSSVEARRRSCPRRGPSRAQVALDRTSGSPCRNVEQVAERRGRLPCASASARARRAQPRRPAGDHRRRRPAPRVGSRSASVSVTAGPAAPSAGSGAGRGCRRSCRRVSCVAPAARGGVQADAASPRARAPRTSAVDHDLEHRADALGHLCCRRPARAASGTSWWLVDAHQRRRSASPTLLPLRAMPPGNGMIAPSTARIASAAASAAASARSTSSPSTIRLPPPTPFVDAEALLARGTRPPSPGSASSAGRRAPCSPASRRRSSAAGRRRRPSSRRRQAVEARGGRAGHHALADALDEPLAHALAVEREQQRRPRRAARRASRPASSTRSIAASHLQPITDVAKPVIERAASCAQRGVVGRDRRSARPTSGTPRRTCRRPRCREPHHAGSRLHHAARGSSSHGSLTG